MADASPETIQQLIENSEKGLAQIEVSLPLILETRQTVEETIKKQDGRKYSGKDGGKASCRHIYR